MRCAASRGRSSATGRVRYARLVRDDFLRYFTPGARARGNSDLAVALPQFGRIVRRNEIARDRWFPGFVPHVSPPAKRVRDYHERVHVPRPLMAALAIAALLQLAIAAAAFALRRPPPPRRREVFLLAGAALAMLLGTAATSEFVLRYLIPVVPLLVCGGVAAAADLAALAARFVPLPLRGRTRRANAARCLRSEPSPEPSARVEEQHHAGDDHRHRDGDQRRGEVARTGEQDQDPGHEQREPGAHRKARRLRAGLLRKAVAAAPAARGTVPDLVLAARTGLLHGPSLRRILPARRGTVSMIGGVGTGRKLTQAGLVTVMVLGGLMLWFGNPVLWLWIGSQMSENQRASMGPYAVVAIGIVVSTILVSLGLARVHRRYQEVSGHIPTVRVRLPWMRSMRGEEDSRPEVTVLDVIVVTTALLGLIAALVWFLAFAGSPLPSA